MSQGAPLHGSLILNPNLKLLDFGEGQVVRHLGNTEISALRMGVLPHDEKQEREKERTLT